MAPYCLRRTKHQAQNTTRAPEESLMYY
eukprot:SAG25_NODE_11028_length_315_cov_1.425926_1_plen_27_part_10